MDTAIGVGASIAIYLAVTIVAFAHWELIGMISERYKQIRYEQGLEEGKKLGRVEGRKEARRRFREFLEQSGIEITEEDKAQLFGEQGEERAS